MLGKERVRPRPAPLAFVINHLPRPFHKLLALLLITFVSIVQANEQQLEVISLQHRLAAELIPSLEAFIDDADVITAQDNLLIIRTSSDTLKQLKTIIQRLDQPIRRLLIEVRQPLTSSRQRQETDISGSISLPDKSGDLRLRTYSTTSRDNAAVDQQIQVLEGHTALIKTGQLVPMAKKQMRSDGRVETIIEQQDISSGFRVTPRLNGATVLLEIMPFSATQASSGGGIINQQQAFTTISSKLGEWVEIGGISSGQQHDGSGTIYKTHERNEQQRQILIRVTEQ